MCIGKPFAFDFESEIRHKKNVPEALERFGKKLGTFGKILGKNYSFPILVCNILSNSCTTA